MQIRARIDSFAHKSAEVEAQRQAVMIQHEEKQRASSKQADTFDERTKELSKVLDQVKAGKPAFSTFIQP